LTHSIVQFNPFYALQQGFYDGSTTLREVRHHGNFGLGAMNAIDGEVVGVDGVFHRIGIDGTLHKVPDDACLPWAMVTDFHPTEEVLHLPPGTDYAGLQAALNGQTRWNNLYLAFRVDGFATRVNARSLPKQTRPYPPLAEVKKTSYELTDVPIIGVGFRSPSYVGAIDPSGYHLHVLTADHRRGGHLNDITLRDATVRVAPIRRFELRLPHDGSFDGAPTPAPSIAGTWQLVEAWDIGDDPTDPSKKTWPWGNPASGYWTYDTSGHFGLQISMNPPLPIPGNPPNPNWITPTAPVELLRETLTPAVYFAYFGTYTVDHGAGTITHQVFADVLREYTGMPEVRPFRLAGNELLIGDDKTYLRRLVRLT
jgi:acetolactate decarboxylase